jgi:hypothetical protein
MGYALDVTAEKMIHALCEAVVLRDRLKLPPGQPEAVLVRDLVEDLAGALGAYAGLPQDGDSTRYGLVKLVWDLHRCTETWHVARVFSRIPELERFTVHPYFSITDMHTLEEWRAKNPL